MLLLRWIMIPTSHLLAFVLTSTALIVVPGPSVLFVISRAVTRGRGAGLATVVGNAAGLSPGNGGGTRGVARVEQSKAIILFVAILPQFIDRSAGHIPMQLLFLGLVSVTIALLSDGTWALAAGTARTWFARSPRRLELLGGTSGLVMIGLGARLALTGRKD